MEPLGLAQGVQRQHVNELCNNRRNATAVAALILARVFSNARDFWLNVPRRVAKTKRRSGIDPRMNKRV